MFFLFPFFHSARAVRRRKQNTDGNGSSSNLIGETGGKQTAGWVFSWANIFPEVGAALDAEVD